MSAVDQLVRGAIDMHVHAGPDPVRERRLDALNLALRAKEAGMRAIVIKSHEYGTAPVASIVNQIVPDFLLIGSLVLNREAGGLGPEAVEMAAKAGAKVVWMPTHSSVVDARKGGIALIGRDGKLVPQMAPILEVIKDYGIIMATGHISVAEIYAITAEAASMQIKTTISHPLTKSAGSPLTLEQQQQLVTKGAYIEHCFHACLPPELAVNPTVMTEHIKAVGVEHCILSTDFGQYYNPTPPEGFRMMVANMLMSGLSEKELEILVKRNPAKLLDLD